MPNQIMKSKKENSLLLKSVAFFIILITILSYFFSFNAFDGSSFVSAYGPPPPPPPPTPSLPSAAAVSVMAPENAADRLDEFDPDEIASVLIDVEISHVIDILGYFNTSLIVDVLGEMEPCLAGQILNQMDVAAAASLIIEMDDTSKNIIECMANDSLEHTALIIEQAVKLLIEGIEESDRNLVLEQLSSVLSNLSTETLVKLFIEIAKLPDTPSTVAYMLMSMNLAKVLDIVHEWIRLVQVESLVNVFHNLPFSIIGEIYRGMSGGDRIQIYQHLSETILASLPAVGVFQVSDLMVSPNRVEPGETTEISFVYSNIGEETDYYTLPIKVNGQTKEAFTGILENGTEQIFSLTISEEIPGIYNIDIGAESTSFSVIEPTPPPKPAEFEVIEIEIIPKEILQGEELTVFVTVKNVGETEGDTTFRIQIDEMDTASKDVSIPGGESTTFMYSFQSDYPAGTHEIKIGDTTKEFIVMEPPIKYPWVTILVILLIIAIIVLYTLYQRGYILV